MEFQTLKGCGKLGTEFDKEDTPGARISIDLFQQLITNIVTRCTKYYELTGDHAFYYKEKQFTSVVCPAIADISQGYLTEYSINRKPRGKEAYRGRVDYWVTYRNYAFIIELKHKFFAYNNIKSPRSRILDSFDEALDQLTQIRKDECRDCATGSVNLIKIALEAIVFYEGSKKPQKREAWKEKNFEYIFRELIKNSKLKQSGANAFALWALHERLVEPYDFNKPKGYFEVYPAVAFVAYISECQA